MPKQHYYDQITAQLEIITKRSSWLALCFALFVVPAHLIEGSGAVVTWFPLLVWIVWFVEEQRFRRTSNSLWRWISLLDTYLISVFALILHVYLSLVVPGKLDEIPLRYGAVVWTVSAVSFAYGLRYGMQRWRTATDKLVAAGASKHPKALTVLEVAEVFFSPPDKTTNLAVVTTLCSVTSFVTLYLSRAGWGDVLFPIVGMLIFGTFPSVIGALISRRIVWRQTFKGDDVLMDQAEGYRRQGRGVLH